MLLVSRPLKNCGPNLSSKRQIFPNFPDALFFEKSWFFSFKVKITVKLHRKVIISCFYYVKYIMICYQQDATPIAHGTESCSQWYLCTYYLFMVISTSCGWPDSEVIRIFLGFLCIGTYQRYHKFKVPRRAQASSCSTGTPLHQPNN